MAVADAERAVDRAPAQLDACTEAAKLGLEDKGRIDDMAARYHAAMGGFVCVVTMVAEAPAEAEAEEEEEEEEPDLEKAAYKAEKKAKAARRRALRKAERKPSKKNTMNPRKAPPREWVDETVASGCVFPDEHWGAMRPEMITASSRGRTRASPPG